MSELVTQIRSDVVLFSLLHVSVKTQTNSVICAQQLTIIHRSIGEWWIFAKPRNGEVNIYHPSSRLIIVLVYQNSG